jgi:hypothetical protein
VLQSVLKPGRLRQGFSSLRRMRLWRLFGLIGGAWRRDRGEASEAPADRRGASSCDEPALIAPHLAATADVLPWTRAAFQGVSGLEQTCQADQAMAGGELVNVLAAGCSPAMGLYGSHR